jgi:hypothetical protein
LLERGLPLEEIRRRLGKSISAFEVGG